MFEDRRRPTASSFSADLLPLKVLGSSSFDERINQDLASLAAAATDKEALTAGLLSWAFNEQVVVTASRFDLSSTRIVVALCDFRHAAGALDAETPEQAMRSQIEPMDFLSRLQVVPSKGWSYGAPTVDDPRLPTPELPDIDTEALYSGRATQHDWAAIRAQLVLSARYDLAAGGRRLLEDSARLSSQSGPAMDWVRQVQDFGRDGTLPVSDAIYFSRSVFFAEAVVSVLRSRESTGADVLHAEDIEGRVELHQDVLQEAALLLAQAERRTPTFRRSFLAECQTIDLRDFYIAVKLDSWTWPEAARALCEPLEHLHLRRAVKSAGLEPNPRFDNEGSPLALGDL